MTTELDNKTLDKIRQHQDFSYALIGGTLAALISAVLWAEITIAMERQIGFMAIGIGFIVGYAVRFFGAGVDAKFGYLGAVLSLLGCMVGNLFTQVGFIANQESLSYLEVVSYLDLAITTEIIVDTFQPMDLLFYGIAIYEGYRFAFRKFSEEEVQSMHADDAFDGAPSAYAKLRMPLTIACLLILSGIFFFLNWQTGGIKVYKNDSGQKISEGEVIDGKEVGPWTFWYENGNVQTKGFFINGQPDSTWLWYTETGKLSKSGSYKNGLEDGVWLTYHENGTLSDSGSFVGSRMVSLWKSWYDNGNLNQIGSYNRNAQIGLWKTYFENGQLNTEGQMDNGVQSGQWNYYNENGQLVNQVTYNADKTIAINNLWDENGNQLILDGNGRYKSFAENGTTILEGDVVDGQRVGLWKAYTSSGILNEEGVYENNLYKVLNNWDIDSTKKVSNGNGIYVSYYEDTNGIFETGEIKNGLREGVWKMYFLASDTLLQEKNYKNGKLNGLEKVFFESGQLYTTCEMIDDRKEGVCTWYHSNGSISSTATFHDDKKEGIQKMYSELGTLIKEEVYKKGELIEEKNIE